MNNQSRRSFLKATARGGIALAILPNFLPARLLGADAPSKKIQVAQIGIGRMGHQDLANVLNEPLARVVAVCEVDSKRLAMGKASVEDFYKERGEAGVKVSAFKDYHDVLASPEIDAVIIAIPDHAHALVAIEAAIAGKHIYLQKPVTYTIVEAIALRKVVEAKQTILQTGSQQRSVRPWGSFRPGSEAVRNGRIGRLHTIKAGISMNVPTGKHPAPMPVPENLDYERWLGPGPEQPYMEGRVHPQDSLSSRPGWSATEDFDLGMITNWGCHHVDIAQWAMGQELGGPLTVESQATWAANDLMTVHHNYHVEMQYPGNVKLILDDKFPKGIRFEGDEGWLFCTRSEDIDAVYKADGQLDRAAMRTLQASDPKILSPLGANAVRWAPSLSHYGNWLESIVANRQPIAPIQQSSRTLEACIAGWVSMKLKRKVTWDVATEMFMNDDAANALRERKSRKPEYDYALAMKRAGIS